MFGRKRVCWVVTMLVFFLFILSMTPRLTHVTNLNDRVLISNGAVQGQKERSPVIAGAPHDPIAIDGDANFTATVSAEGWSGNGSSQDPFMIEGLDIDLAGSAGHCIYIANTRMYFVIRDCYLANATMGNGAGISLENVTHGQVLDNICTKNRYGLLAGSSSANCTLLRNTCTFNSVSGIYLDGSYSLIVRSNNCSWNSDYGIAAGGSDHIIADNTCSNNDYCGLNAGGSFLNVVNNTCESNENGIVAYGPNSIVGNTCNNNSFTGIIAGEDGNVSNNMFAYNALGTYAELEENTLIGNYYIGNQLGVYLPSSAWNNVLQWNVFLDNQFTCNDMGSSLSTIDHNYWSDYGGADWDYDGIGDTPYVFSGGIDPYPLMYLPTLPSWIELPVDQTAELGLCFRYDLNATVPELSVYPNTTLITPTSLTWSVNDTAHFYIDCEGVITSWNLELKDYGLKVTVSNFYGRTIDVDIRVRVEEYLPPGWMNVLTDHFLGYGEPFDCQVTAVDNAGIAYWTINDTINFFLTAHEFLRGGTARVMNSSVLAPGAYGLNITVYDLGGNSISGVFSVFVNPTEPDTTGPIWTTIFIGLTVDYGEAVRIQLGAWDSSSIDHWWLNDTTHFMVHDVGIIKNGTLLQVGVYGLEARAYDPYDNYCSATIIVTVVESTISAQTEGDGTLLIVGGVGVGGAATIVVILAVLRRRGGE